MKKTAIVSCYFIHNYGSMLQAYATQNVLDQLGIENETINVSGFLKDFRKAQYLYIIKSGLSSDILKTRIGKARNLLIKKFVRNQYTKNIGKRDKKFAEFGEKTIRLSDVFASTDELGRSCSKLYDCVLIGSDQLWLPANIAADYYTLNFVPEELNSVAYATSFGVSDLPEDAAQMARAFLPKIKHISVREQSGQALVEKLTDRKVPVVCDPTLLMTGEEWMKIQQEAPLVEEPYIFCYFIGKTPLHREFARRLKEKTGYKIVAFTHVDHFVKCDEGYADETPYEAGPAEFVNMIRNAAYVCTDSFHCSVFSILYKKEFYAFRRFTSQTKQSTNSRLDTLFDLVGISGRMLQGDEQIERCMEMHIDYETVHRNLDRVRARSMEYLQQALKNEQNTDMK